MMHAFTALNLLNLWKISILLKKSGYTTAILGLETTKQS